MTKACSKCRVEKPLLEFHSQPSGRFGRHSWCRSCANSCARAHRKRTYSSEQKRRWLLRSRYGISPEAHDEMMRRQGGLCAICRTAMARVCVDHSHGTGAVRGLLCHACNVKLASIEDAAYRVAALAYLESRCGS